MVVEHSTLMPHAGPIGASTEWQDVLRKAAQVVATNTTVLICGESGTGKEVVARVIHQASPRKNAPFVALNCAALPEQLLEAELFGCERGAFTGAQLAKPGQIELAAGGVLFLDEVSDMTLSAQAKFLRVLQEREFQRLGGTRVLKANIRVVAATNRDLRQAVDAGECEADARSPRGALAVRLAGERPRAAQRPRACGDPVRRRAHHSTASVPRIHRRAVARQRRHQPRHHGAGDDRQGPARLPLEQVGGRQTSPLVAYAALRPHATAQHRRGGDGLRQH
jgi:transcriptional regulator of aromatic amino acid metabolism